LTSDTKNQADVQELKDAVRDLVTGIPDGLTVYGETSVEMRGNIPALTIAKVMSEVNER